MEITLEIRKALVSTVNLQAPRKLTTTDSDLVNKLFDLGFASAAEYGIGRHVVTLSDRGWALACQMAS